MRPKDKRVIENMVNCATLISMPTRTDEPATQETEACRIPVEHHCVYCPTCSSRLKDHRCKLVCPQCGYFLSCADFY